MRVMKLLREALEVLFGPGILTPALVLLGGSAAGQTSFAPFLPLELGYSWKYVDAADPSSFSYVDAIASAEAVAPGALILGSDPLNGWIVANDGTAVTFYGSIDAGVLKLFSPPKILAVVDDGTSFKVSPTDLLVIREWSALDPALLASVGGYGVDPAEPDLLLWVWYDTCERPGLQNPILESGGGTVYPYGVTDVDWLKKDHGFFAQQGVNAGLAFDPVSGTFVHGLLEEHYDVTVTFDCDDNQVPDHLDPDCNLDEIPDACQPPSETVRLGSPPNPPAFLPGLTSGPVIGATWDPVVDHAAFAPGAVLDFVLVSPVPANVTTPFGTLLCTPPPPGLISTSPPGVPFALAVPNDCALIGAGFCSQAGSMDAAGLFQLANALDLVVGAL